MGWFYGCCGGDDLEQWEVTEQGSLLPDTDGQRDIGSADRRVRSLYVSGNTIYIDGHELTRNQDNRLAWDGNVLAYDDIGALHWDETGEGHLRPPNNNIQDLGTAEHSIRNLHIGDRVLSVNDRGQLTLDNWPLAFALPTAKGGDVPDDDWETTADGGTVTQDPEAPAIQEGSEPPQAEGGTIE